MIAIGGGEIIVIRILHCRSAKEDSTKKNEAMPGFIGASIVSFVRRVASILAKAALPFGGVVAAPMVVVGFSSGSGCRESGTTVVVSGGEAEISAFEWA